MEHVIPTVLLKEEGCWRATHWRQFGHSDKRESRETETPECATLLVMKRNEKAMSQGCEQLLGAGAFSPGASRQPFC